MDEEQGWLKYHYDRVLIESARIITPTLPGCTLVLNGAQVEMLRNCVHYLDRRSTFVSEYGDLTYETPDDDGWDDIRAQVADLEELLMGNENVPFGVNDRWAESASNLSAVAGTNTLESAAVPAGTLYVLQALTGLNANNICSMRFRVKSASIACTLTTFINQAAGVVAANDYTGIVLAEGDQAQVVFDSCTLNDDLYLVVWGYKMKV